MGHHGEKGETGPSALGSSARASSCGPRKGRREASASSRAPDAQPRVGHVESTLFEGDEIFEGRGGGRPRRMLISDIVMARQATFGRFRLAAPCPVAGKQPRRLPVAGTITIKAPGNGGRILLCRIPDMMTGDEFGECLRRCFAFGWIADERLNQGQTTSGLHGVRTGWNQAARRQDRHHARLFMVTIGDVDHRRLWRLLLTMELRSPG